MADMVFGIFTERDDAEDAIEELKTAGFPTEELSIMMKNTTEGESLARDTGTNVAEGAVTGATTGGVVGAIAGLLIGVGAIAIPGLGAFLIGGPLAAALGLTGAAATTVSGAATGALAGGILGGLMGLGVPEEDARVYEQYLNEGAILIAVPTRERHESQARDILEENGADRVRTIRMDETRFRGATTRN
jgi:hypothetical protein